MRVPRDATDVEIQDALCKIFQKERDTETEREGQSSTQKSNISADQCILADRECQRSESRQHQFQSSGSLGSNEESASDQKSGTRRAAIDSEQKNTDQRSIRRRSSQRSVIKPKSELSSILAEITKEDEQSINANAAILSVYSGSKISLDNSLKERINSLLKIETPYCDIIQRIEEGTSEVLVGDLKYKMRGTMLMALPQRSIRRK